MSIMIHTGICVSPDLGLTVLCNPTTKKGSNSSVCRSFRKKIYHQNAGNYKTNADERKEI